MTLLQIYCLVCFEIMFKIDQYLAKLRTGKKADCLSAVCARRGTALLKDEELA